MEITHQDLTALRESLEETMRREVDRCRDDLKEDMRGVHARIKELRDAKNTQNGRVGKSEDAIAQLQADVRIQRHDLKAHTDAHEVFMALVNKIRRGGASDGDTDSRKPSKAFIGGAIATVMVLAGIANWVLDLAHGLGAMVLKVLFKP